MESSNIFERFHLYSLPDKFYAEPRDRNGSLASTTYLEIDRSLNTLQLKKSAEHPIPVVQADLQQIYGIIGVIELVSGYHLIVVKRAELVGRINDAEVYRIVETDVLPYKKTVLHLTERQVWFNRQFVEMVQLVLSGEAFYYSPNFDLSHTFQWLAENDSPHFRNFPMIERLARYAAPIIHGFVGIRQYVLRGSAFKLILISRRSNQRAGVRFYMRGADQEGNSANFVETEQIVEFDKGDKRTRRFTSFVQIRGSIPLYWSQKPNLRWQPLPCLKAENDHADAFRKHMNLQRQNYGGKQVIINLVNQKGRERRVGGELERVCLETNLDFVKYVGFDFHRECQSLNWDGVNALCRILLPDITQFGFFYMSADGGPTDRKYQTGFFRTNCMDCLDRTNVVQAMVDKESLRLQLIHLGIVDGSLTDLDLLPDFLHVFKNLWADNGDECSKQYAGTGALKTDYTRVGKRTTAGALQDGVNAITRYFKNNFSDGYKQDAIDLFLGNYRVDSDNLPQQFETSLLNLNANGGAIVGAVFSAAMMILCVLVSENVTATLFWMVIFAAFMLFIFLNGEEFVNKPKLKID